MKAPVLPHAVFPLCPPKQLHPTPPWQVTSPLPVPSGYPLSEKAARPSPSPGSCTKPPTPWLWLSPGGGEGSRGGSLCQEHRAARGLPPHGVGFGGVRGERAAWQCRRAGSRTDVSALLKRNGEHHAGGCRQAQLPRCAGRRGDLCLLAWMPGAPSAKGPGHVGWGHDSVSPRCGLWAAVSGGRGVLEGNRMAMGWMHRLRMWVKDVWRAWLAGQ